MQSGAEALTIAEEMLQSVQVRVAMSRRRLLDAWSNNLVSPFWRLYRNDRPGGSLVVQGIRIPMRPGHLYLIPSGVAFQTVLAQPFTHSYIHFYLTGFPQSLQSRLFPGVLAMKQDELLGELAARWEASLADGRPADWSSLWWANALVHAALSTATASMDPAVRREGVRWVTQAREVRPALTAIEEAMSDPPSNSRLASLCGLSLNHFIRTFRKAVGVTPARYSIERRLAVASSLLVGSTKSIDFVAAATGFTDRFYFSRAFKARFGLAPAAYRRLQHHRA